MNTAFAVDDQGLSWRFAGLIPGSPPKEFRLPGLPETPVVGYDLPVFGRCLFKMEQDCPTGSHKDRAAIFQVSVARANTAKGLIIPSSGNAAIAVAAAGAACSLPVYAFLAPGTQSGKVQAMARVSAAVDFLSATGQPCPECFPSVRIAEFATIPGRKCSRGIHDTGFRAGRAVRTGTLRQRVCFFHQRSHPDRHRPRIRPDAPGRTPGKIFLSFMPFKPDMHPDSLGSSIRAIWIRKLPPDARGPGFGGVSGSALYPELTAHLRNSHGSGWLIDDNEMTAAKSILDEVGIVTSPEGWCSLAATRRWRESGGRGTPLIVLTGKQRSDPVSSLALERV